MNNKAILWQGGREMLDERERMRRQLELLLESQFYVRHDPKALMTQLEEIDSRLLDMILEQRGWQRIGGVFGAGLELSDSDRLSAVGTARYMTYYDTQSKAAVQTWTDFGFGQSVEVTPRDPGAQMIWNEFWNARRNQPVLGERVLHEQSNEAVLSGEVFYSLWTSQAGGMSLPKTTIRAIRTEEIAQIISVPDDPMLNVWHIQSVEGVRVDGKTYTQVAYRDWQATDAQVEEVGALPSGAIDAAQLRPNTGCVMLYASRNRYLVDGKTYRGFPEFKQAYEWFMAYRNALGDMMAKNRAVAMFVDKLKVSGGQSAVSTIAARLASATATTADSLSIDSLSAPTPTWIENQAMDRSRMPLGTAAGDDQAATMIVLGQGSAGTQVPLGWMGRPDSWQNQSVAEMTVLPWNETMRRYQSWWASVFRDMARIVITQSGLELEQTDVDVTLDTLITVNTAEVLSIISSLSDMVAKGTMSTSEAADIVKPLIALALSKFGVSNAGQAVEKPENPGTIESVIALAAERAKEDGISAQDVAEWAVAELLEQSR